MTPSRRRHTALLVAVILTLLLVPSVALADSGGSDTGAFARFAGQGSFIALGASLFFGFVSSLTPCVFPMVPITVAIFGATESSSRARGAALSATFVLGIATLFTPLGLFAALSGTLLGSALANPWVVTAIAILFLALASSMFGAFEMTLPASINNKLSTVGGVGFKGAFVLGLVMGLIAAPCTGPFLTGMVTWIATTKNLALGSIAMFLFAVGLGIPFFIAGAFAVNLPKGGAWMLGIKWASGVALAYMALAYLRDSFPTIQKAIVPGTVYGVIAGVVLLVGLGLGIVHVAAERRKSPIAHLSKPMKLASILPAVGGAFMFISWAQMAGASNATVADNATAPTITWKDAASEETARTEAVTAKKPVLVDFGATWCKGCMELEHNTWPDPKVRTQLSRFVPIKVDATDDDDENTKKLTKKYDVKGLPTVILFDSEGKEQARFNEYVPADKMVTALASVK